MRAFCRIDAPGRIDLVRAYLTIILGLARRFYDRRARPTTPVAPDRLVPRFRLALEQHFPRLLEVGEFARLLQVALPPQPRAPPPHRPVRQRDHPRSHHA